ncbi:MAG: D-glycero-beta-D-manno-heptose-7-phosphate kinase, partial [Odoribacter sp.]|nr:D-glycero-beta-D-manno-heptose-7-phosphate kinase [Odoribacter sp.]
MDFTRCKILIIGDIMLDKYYFGKVERISPEAPVPVVNIKKEETRLGGASNVAHNIASLGGQVLL